MASDLDAALIRAQCARVLAANWREGVRASDRTPFAYTCPAAGHYPWQWYWDSCFAAIANAQLDPAHSRRELESLLNAQRADGFIGHTIFWTTPLSGFRRLTYNLGSDASMTASIQPPLLAWAWSLAVGDPSEDARILAHHGWLEANRDLDGDGLLWIVQPDESGLDASPQFDQVWGRRAHSRVAFPTLVWFNRRHGYDARAIHLAGGPVVSEVATNVLYGLSRATLGLGSITPALIDRCWDERRGLFLPVWRTGRSEQRGGPSTWAALAPLALDDLPEAIGRRMVEEHLLDPARYRLAAGPPSVAADEPSFRARESVGFHPLLARADVDQFSVAALAWSSPPGLWAPGGGTGGGGGAKRGHLRAARVLPPVHRRGHGPAGLQLVDTGVRDALSPAGRPSSTANLKG